MGKYFGTHIREAVQMLKTAWDESSAETTGSGPIVGYRTCSDHEVVPTCDCGANAICYTCGFGRGTLPCDCTGRPRPDHHEREARNDGA